MKTSKMTKEEYENAMRIEHARHLAYKLVQTKENCGDQFVTVEDAYELAQAVLSAWAKEE